MAFAQAFEASALALNDERHSRMKLFSSQQIIELKKLQMDHIGFRLIDCKFRVVVAFVFGIVEIVEA